MKKTYTYLALGDSYTIGEGVEEAGRYPNQTVNLLQGKGIDMNLSQIIAKTGWTTDELEKGIESAGIEGNTYDLVTLLIGVNNQYRGRDVENYKSEFRLLLQDAINFAKGKADHVVVLSIPDWGVTPFATERNTDQEKVAREINIYNQAKKEIAQEMGTHHIDITERYREIGALPEMVVEDKLHPSALVYQEWASLLAKIIEEKMAFK
ncbi:SGNH/GDSL hydrolase family protein [Fontibacter flavus]|uniref:SGNH/GDSL hydrolase family protein n=1 Tax=Fontibacter flavus TaxID=654838 RepID=A0ABV6FSF6_9BACT